MKKLLLILALPIINLFHSQTTIVSSNNNVVGLEHNTLFNATKRYSVSQTGAALPLEKLFDGKFDAAYTTEQVTPANPKVILIENLTTAHTQLGAWVGWSTRYYYAKRFKIEGYDTFNSANQWRILADYSSTDYNSNLFIVKIPVSGIYTKLRYTFYATSESNNLLGLSEIFFLHPEGWF